MTYKNKLTCLALFSCKPYHAATPETTDSNYACPTVQTDVIWTVDDVWN